MGSSGWDFRRYSSFKVFWTYGFGLSSLSFIRFTCYSSHEFVDRLFYS
ncbi:hypothetical protein ZOSMA_8G01990 [Zostera marina]|uniref:Uncharacterized protein n=1 Tax=Zostera marina TaxID=29655 RepID=A0A0K9NM39_ZOSMR|nr:hypothetical protein ZOSMA_8G01990 [Zostera marina]